MKKGLRASSSSESEGSRESDSGGPSGGSSDPEQDQESEPESSSSSDLEVEARGGAMKRSQGFSTSFSFAEDDDQPQQQQQQQLQQQQQQQSGDEDDHVDQKNSNNGVPVVVVVPSGKVEEEAPPEPESGRGSDGTQPQRSGGLFRPQQLWLAVSRCLSLRWPPCLSISRQSNAKLAYQPDRPEDLQSSLGSRSSSSSSSSSSTSSASSFCAAPAAATTLLKPADKGVQSRAGVGGRGGGSAPRRGLSRSTSRLPRARAAADPALASLVLLEKETFLRVELVESGDQRDEGRYRAEWKLSERSRDLAEGVWLSRSPRPLAD